MVLSDPPYGIEGATLDKHYNRKEAHVLDGYVDVKADDYSQFSHNWIAQASRVLLPGGRLIVVSGYSQLPAVLGALDDKANNLRAVRHIIWKYNFGVWTTRKFVSSHYHILFYEKIGGKGRACGEDSILRRYGSVWEIKREYQRGQTKNKNQLPVALLERLIKIGSPTPSRHGYRPVVADFFLGSFSTARVAIALGRDATGFEVNKTGFDYWEPVTRALLSEVHEIPSQPTYREEALTATVPTSQCLPTALRSAPTTPINLVIAWPNTVPTAKWFKDVEHYLCNGGSFFFVTSSSLLAESLRHLRATGLREVNHIIWAMRGTMALTDAHLHVLFYEKPKSNRTFHTYAFYSASTRLATGQCANYIDREDVWRPGITTHVEVWSDVVRKIVEYTTNQQDSVATFCLNDHDAETVIVDLNRTLVT